MDARDNYMEWASGKKKYRTPQKKVDIKGIKRYKSNRRKRMENENYGKKDLEKAGVDLYPKWGSNQW
ncbi:unnamed protein product [Euphydryas editha]|uniref:Uncharacterized protein n=1 Tax=Euphydryas editha TaxID=104508 RepID=A0AAU9TP65_EUPED|nr:unnamed protein product [Euphydryas editha]